MGPVEWVYREFGGFHHILNERGDRISTSGRRDVAIQHALSEASRMDMHVEIYEMTRTLVGAYDPLSPKQAP